MTKEDIRARDVILGSVDPVAVRKQPEEIDFQANCEVCGQPVMGRMWVGPAQRGKGFTAIIHRLEHKGGSIGHQPKVTIL